MVDVEGTAVQCRVRLQRHSPRGNIFSDQHAAVAVRGGDATAGGTLVTQVAPTEIIGKYEDDVEPALGGRGDGAERPEH